MISRSLLCLMSLAYFSSTGLLGAQGGATRPRGSTARPRAFGTDVYEVTTIPGVSLNVPNWDVHYFTTPTLARYGESDNLTDFYAGVDLPAGALVDAIGVNTITNVDLGVGLDLLVRDQFGGLTVVGSLSSSVHGNWATDYTTAPVGFLWYGGAGESLVLHVQTAATPQPQFVAFVEIWWKRLVSASPSDPTFLDVPTSHPFYDYIEALAASGITGGCGNGNYCPDAPLTRGQMAVFLAKALGLNWGLAPAPGTVARR